LLQGNDIKIGTRKLKEMSREGSENNAKK